MTLIEKAGYILRFMLRVLNTACVMFATTFLNGAVILGLLMLCVGLLSMNPETATFSDFLRFIHSPAIPVAAAAGGVTSMLVRIVFSIRQRRYW
ncbi:hypothetical protein ABH908_000122 [Pseudomonas frederiksbergensis]|uniref:hypothetical protein n=1 Tax=Pseudomonas TaxID=286 RepID=UPI003D19E9D6